MELVALQVQIGLKGNGEWDYPDFDRITPAKRGNAPWHNFVDRTGGWCYDNVASHNEIDEVSPDEGIQLGCILVPEPFAAEAVQLFEDQVAVLSEEEFSKFYDERAMVNVPSEKINADIVNGLRAKYGQSGALDPSVMSAEEQQMLDPEHPRPGISKNRKGKFADLKSRQKLTLKTLD